MSIQAIAAVLELEDDRLDALTGLVLIGIANHVSPDGQCFPSVRKLMIYSKSSERAVRGAIKSLEEFGFIRVERRTGTSSLYYLTIPVQGVQGGGAAAAGVGVREVHPNRKGNRNDNASDARAGLDEGWQPSPETRAQLDREYPTIDIDDQVKSFVLKSRANATVHANPDEAFKAWMHRTKDLKVQPKARAAAAGSSEVDPAALRQRIRTGLLTRGRWEPEKVSEEAIRFAAADKAQGNNELARDWNLIAYEVAMPGSWHQEQADAAGKAHWGDTWKEDARAWISQSSRSPETPSSE